MSGVSLLSNTNAIMTVKPVKEPQERVSASVSELHKPKELSSTDLAMTFQTFHNLSGEKVSKVDRKEETAKASLKSRKKVKYVHSQILRIREEDSHLGEDFSLGTKDSGHLCHQYHDLHLEMDVVPFSRPILPSSPLSGKTTTLKASH